MAIKYCLFLLLILPARIYAQGVTPLKQEDFTYAGYEVKATETTVKAFIQANLSEFYVYTQREDKYYTIKDLYHALHFIDVNGDGLLDVIFEGQSGGEGTIIKIFMRSQKGYSKVFEERQALTRVVFENKRLTEITVTDRGCCADYVTYKKQYTVSFPGSKPVFKQIRQIAFISEGAVPDSMFTAPFKFVILNNNYNFRCAPFIDDSSSHEWSDASAPKGNVIGKFSEGAICTALGKKIDDTGREWWYIETATDCVINESAFYTGDKLPTNKRGWVSNRFVQALQSEAAGR